jgi:hypothetical protein
MDLDGFLSGYFLKKYILKSLGGKEDTIVTNEEFLEENEENYNNVIYARPYNYGDNLDVDIGYIDAYISKGTQVKVYFVDCCPYGDKSNYFDKLYSLLRQNLIIVDHHKTAVDFIGDYERQHNVKVSGELVVGLAGCELTEYYIRKNEFRGEKEFLYDEINRDMLPLIIKLVGSHDVHRVSSSEFSWEETIVPFEYWLRSEIVNFNDIVHPNILLDYHKDRVSFDTLENICKQGESILKYLASRNKKLLASNGHMTLVNFLGKEETMIECFWATDYLNNSQIFEDNDCYNDPNIVYMLIKPDIYTGTYEVTLYSINTSEIDVSAIAKSMHGGGHLHAAGFKASKVAMRQNADLLDIVALPK